MLRKKIDLAESQIAEVPSTISINAKIEQLKSSMRTLESKITEEEKFVEISQRGKKNAKTAIKNWMAEFLPTTGVHQ